MLPTKEMSCCLSVYFTLNKEEEEPMAAFMNRQFQSSTTGYMIIRLPQRSGKPAQKLIDMLGQI